MPNYTYKCETCDKVCNLILPMSHKPEEVVCEDKTCDAQGSKMQRVYTAPGVVWKCGGRTETTSETKEKNAKLKKLWDDSYVGD